MKKVWDGIGFLLFIGILLWLISSLALWFGFDGRCFFDEPYSAPYRPLWQALWLDALYVGHFVHRMIYGGA